ncbi:hypothetical protein [Xylophilus ampelinus]|uniref:hypothetical protein n=1 Tax=Xylophilus ampelinus TaxID=54067 RepID=UPI0011B3DE7D|nr:hypothetical protein [Xylophilus ampelinus]MCS4508697.1 hypothetical protein [Xylophilus ampelinus]
MRYSKNSGKICAKRSFSALILVVAATLNGAAYARNIGSVTVDADVTDNQSAPPKQIVFNQHWSAAYTNCKKAYSATVAVDLVKYYQNGSVVSEGVYPIESLWNCRDH